MPKFDAFSLIPTPVFVYDGDRTGECAIVATNHAAVAAGAPTPLRYCNQGVLQPGLGDEAGWVRIPGKTLFEDVMELCCMTGGPLSFTQGPVGSRGCWWRVQAWAIRDADGRNIVVCVLQDISAERQALNEASKREEMAGLRLATAQRRYCDEQYALKRLALQLDEAVAEMQQLVVTAQLKIPPDLGTRLHNASDVLRQFCQASDGELEVLIDELQSPSMCGAGEPCHRPDGNNSTSSSGAAPSTPGLSQLHHAAHTSVVDSTSLISPTDIEYHSKCLQQSCFEEQLLGGNDGRILHHDDQDPGGFARHRATNHMAAPRLLSGSGPGIGAGPVSLALSGPTRLFSPALQTEMIGPAAPSSSTKSQADIQYQALQAASGLQQQLTSQFTDMDAVLSHAAALAASIDMMQLQLDTMASANARAAGQLELKKEEQLLQQSCFKEQMSKATAEGAELKLMYDKAMLEAAEERHVLKTQLTQATADLAEYKAAYEKIALDATELQVEFDLLEGQAATQKSTLVKALTHRAVMRQEMSASVAQLQKAHADNAEMKAAFEKVMTSFHPPGGDFVQSLSHINQLLAARTAETQEAQAAVVELKTRLLQTLADSVKRKTMFDGQLSHAQTVAMHMKAAYEKSQLDATSQNAGSDTLLQNALANATALKAALDKSTVDAVQQKSLFDAQLNKATADAAEFKAAYDKSTADAVEAKTVFDAQLGKATADAAEFKAAFDKSTVDAVEAKVAFDAQLGKATADAAEMKAGWDKSTADAVEAKTVFDAQLGKATADAAEFKAAFDKSTADAVEAKTVFDAQLGKATADASEFKAAFDKSLVDAAELKLEFDAQLDKAHADTVEMKAAFDKTTAQALKMKLEYDEQAAQLQKAQADNAEITLQRAQAEVEANLVKEALNNQQEALQNLMDEHAKLVHQRDVLHAELQLALNNYTPKAVIDAGTPADKMLSMLTDLLDGNVPSIQDILYVQSAILESLDIYQPIDLGKQLMAAKSMDQDVGLALMKQLGASEGPASALTGVSLEDFCSGRRGGRSSSDGASADSATADSFQTLEAALSCMYSPDFEYCQAQADADGAGSVGAVLHRRALRAGQDLALAQTQKGRQPVRRSATGLIRRKSCLVPEDVCIEEDDLFPVPSAGPIVDEVMRALESAKHWQFDAFKLCEVTQGHPLSALGYYTLHQAGLITHFNMKPAHLARFLRAIEDGYINNPYHSKTHAADVLQTYNLILKRGGLIPGYVDPLTHVACLLAAVVHDYEHVGRTNDFLIATSNDLAILYNDRAPLENHHLAAAFQLLRKPDYNFLPDLTKAEYDKLRKTIIDLVLATDMKQHFSIVSHFTTVHRLGVGGSMAPSIASHNPRRSISNASSANNSLYGGVGSGLDDEDTRIVVPLDETERLISLQLALKCSDLGHVAAALPVHLKWVAGLEEEFFRQGDAERAAGLPMSPLFDRSKQGISKSQVGFFDIVVIPLYHSLSRVFTGTKPLLTFVMRNYKVWNERQGLDDCPK